MCYILILCGRGGALRPGATNGKLANCKLSCARAALTQCHALGSTLTSKHSIYVAALLNTVAFMFAAEDDD